MGLGAARGDLVHPAPLGFGRQAVDVPDYLISASILATAAVVYVVDVRRVHSLGAVLVGTTLALLAASHTWMLQPAIFR